MLVNGRGTGRSSTMGADTSEASLTQTEEFYTAISRSFEQTELALTTARTGANLQTARGEISNPGGAIDWKDRALIYLTNARNQGELSMDDAQRLLAEIVGPLSGSITDAKIAIDRGGNYLTRYWDAFQTFLASLVSGTVGFWGSEWKKAVKAYRLLLDMIQANEDAVSRLSELGPDPGIEPELLEIKKKAGELRAIALGIEAKAKASGAPSGYLKKEAESLGANPGGLLALPIIAGITVGGMIKIIVGGIIGGIIAAMGFALYGEGTIIPHWLRGQAYLQNESLKLMQNEKAARTEFDRQEAEEARFKNEAQEKIAVEAIDRTRSTAKGLAELFPQAGKTPADIDAKIKAERQKAGLLPELEASSYFWWAMGGVALAGTVYYIRTRDSA